MSHSQPQRLNERFAIPGRVKFDIGPGNTPVATLSHSDGSATVSLHGGHVTSYQPAGHKEVLWISRLAKHQPGKAIRGGIPICWPWFADHPTDPEKPAHGVVRGEMWQVHDTGTLDGDQVQIRLTMTDSIQTRTIWPHPFQVTVAVTMGRRLGVEVVGVHGGDHSAVFGGALHCYFAVQSVGHITIQGLEGRSYIDKIDSSKRKIQQGPVTITDETDRIYVDTPGQCVIEDPQMGRRIHIAKTNSRSTVIWNPWSDKAARMTDFGDDEYHKMVCVETANALDDVMTLAPGQAHRMGTQISAEHM